MDHPVYGAQFISKSKVMAAGLRPAFRPNPSPCRPPSPPRPRPRSTVPTAGTLKFQTNTKMAGIKRNMYCPISSGPGQQRGQAVRAANHRAHTNATGNRDSRFPGPWTSGSAAAYVQNYSLFPGIFFQWRKYLPLFILSSLFFFSRGG